MKKTQILGAVFAVACLHGPTVSGADSGGLVARFDTAFARLDSLIFSEDGVGIGPGSDKSDGSDGSEKRMHRGASLQDGRCDDGGSRVGAFGGFGYRVTSPVSAELDAALHDNTDAKIREGNAKTGLQLTGQAYYRAGSSTAFDDETGEGRYRAKFQAELRWYFLQSALFGKEGRRNVAELEEAIARAGYEKERTDINDFRIKQRLTEHYDSLLAGVLYYRVNTLQLLDEAQNCLLGEGRISSDALVATLNERMEAERKLAGIGRPYPAARSLEPMRGTVVSIDSALLVKHVMATSGDMKLLELRIRLLEQQEDNVSYWKTLNVAPFVRYSYYGRCGLPDSWNLDVGVSFTIPLSGETCRKKETLRSEQHVLRAEEGRLSRRVVDKVGLVAAEVERLNRASVGELARINRLREYLHMRGDGYRNGLGEHDRLARAKEYAMYVGCLERLIDYQYRRDCLVADLQALVPDESILSFCYIDSLEAVVSQRLGTDIFEKNDF